MTKATLLLTLFIAAIGDVLSSATLVASQPSPAEQVSSTEESTTSGTRFTRQKLQIRSAADQTLQPSYLLVPGDGERQPSPRPLVVTLHSWSADVEQRNAPLEQLALQRGWLVLAPHFRGVNNQPEACGSLLAQQDILDAVEWVLENHAVDPYRIYLTGSSGGGHMTLLMAGRHSHRWTAASAWVPITDLTHWHRLHADGRYGEMMRLSCGGPPGAGVEVDHEYRQRSPITHLAGANHLPVDIAAGIHDGHTGSVPIDHSLYAFNILAAVHRADPVTHDEIQQLLRPDGRLDHPRPSDQVEDDSFGRAIYLRRHAGPSRVTIFEGGHEGIAAAAISWLADQKRLTYGRNTGNASKETDQGND